ncbi:MAG: redox-regulated ATPase YchF [Deltaproteobacteria bacterium]|nr:redox-regulated ATPase YchF [Deltaproteobacteria bacterium]
MGFNCGIVGLPNVGKSTIFNALTQANAQAANYPFCTIDPNVGVVPVPDERLQKLADIFQPDKLTPTTVEFVDIAGLVKGASKGEGLGNQFLGNIKNCDAIVHILRCFEDSDVVHVEGEVDPIRDFAVVETELMLKDLESVDKRILRVEKIAKMGDKAAKLELEALSKAKATLDQGIPLRKSSLTEEEKLQLHDLYLITIKPIMMVANTSEADIKNPGPHVKQVEALAQKEQAPYVILSGKMEAEIASLAPADQQEFLKELGLTHSGLGRLAQAGYRLLNLATFFTAGPQEVRAWTITQGMKAPQAAGKIHNDFEKGFIKAEVYHFNDLIKCGTEAKVKEAGLYRIEGKEYVVKDGDIMFFRFNV